jgi:putative transferase (TIGR04331 family)
MPNKKSPTSGTCLAVSNCKSCWDTNHSKLAFISDSTPDYFDREWLKTIDHVVLEGPWCSREYVFKSEQFVIERVTRYRKELSSILNMALGLGYGERAWGFLLDSWLLHFTSVIYDRVHKLENARDQLGEVYLNSFRDDLPLVQTTESFVRNCFNDRFNQQLFGEVANTLGIKVVRYVDCSAEDGVVLENAIKKNLKHKVHQLFRLVPGWWIKFRKPVVIMVGYFPPVEKVLIFLRSMGGILMLPRDVLLGKIPEHKEDESLRMRLKVIKKDRFDLVANNLFAKLFPVSLLEGLKNYSEKISGLEVMPVLGSAAGLYYHEEYKILASRVIESGNKIIGFQHGGNYNFEKNGYFCGEYLEKLNVDKFYRWKEKSLFGKLLPATRLAKLSRCKENRKRRRGFWDILFLHAGAGRFVYRQAQHVSDTILKTIVAQQNFYFNLDENVAKYFLLRPYPVDHGWRYKERWLDLTGGEIRFDPNREFIKSLMSCRVFVTDHISTTWLEALSMDVPVLLFFDIRPYNTLDEVKILFEELQDIGVFHSTPESAASFLNKKYETIEEWWKLPKTKETVDKVKNYFFTDSGDFTKEWTRELLALRDKAKKGEWVL